MAIVLLFSRVMTLREHNRWVVKVHLQKGSEGKIVSARWVRHYNYQLLCMVQVLFDKTVPLLLTFLVIFSNAGDVRFWDPRFTESVRTLNLTQGITALEIHKHADVLAW